MEFYLKFEVNHTEIFYTTGFNYTRSVLYVLDGLTVRTKVIVQFFLCFKYMNTIYEKYKMKT